MDKIILGTAFITDKGDWVSGTAYEINDLVHTSKGVYMSLIDNNTEEPPTSNWRLWVDTEAVNNVNNILATKVDKDEIINSNGDLMTNTATITSTTVDLNDYVDLGLPSGTLWSKYNYGSSSETASGLYFQWGATVGYSASDATSHSSWTTCPGNNGNSSYDASSFTAWMSGNIHSKLLCDDVDAVQVGTVGGAKIPTQSQYNELLTNTTWSWTTINGVAGSKFSNKNDASKYIFIPVSGYINGTSATSTGTCYVWSKTLADSTNQGAYGLVITSSGASWGTLNRQVSMPIRSVVVASKVTLPQGEGVLALKSDIVLPTATSYTLGGVKSSTTGTTANRDYKVEVNTDGTMKVNVPWVDTNTTYSNVTTSAAGLMSTSDKSKLDGIAANANNYTLPTASTTALGGVKVDDALSTTSTNPVQNKVINSSITSINNSINSINSTIAEMSYVYGVRHYYSNSSPSLTRIGASNLHVTLPVQSLMKRCILADDGTVVYYLDPSDSTKKADGTDAILDGTDGQVMVEVPTHYRRCTLTNTYYDVEISLVPFTGAKKINKFYVSAYEAALDRNNNKLASVVNKSTQYRGGNNTSSWDDTYRSLLGMPVTAISTVTFHTYGTNRGTGWDMYEADIHDTIAWLFYIEYATLNSQLAYNENLTTEGYHQGGLGNGVIGKDRGTWSTYNGNNPIIPCGTTNSLGNKSGVVSYSPLASDGSSVWGTFSVPSYRGIENPYAHIWKWAVGYMGVGNGTNQVAYRCRNRSQYSTSSLNNYYNKVGLISSSGGWTKTIVKNEYGDIIPTSVGAGDTTYFSDYLWEAHANGSIYAYLFGGCLHLGSCCGFGCLNLAYGFGHAFSYIGSRLCYSAYNQIIE